MSQVVESVLKWRRWPYHVITIRGWCGDARPAPLVFARTSPLWVTRAKLRVVSRSVHPGSRPRCRSPPRISGRMLLSRHPWHGIGNRTGIRVPWYALASAWCEVALSHTRGARLSFLASASGRLDTKMCRHRCDATPWCCPHGRLLRLACVQLL